MMSAVVFPPPYLPLVTWAVMIVMNVLIVKGVFGRGSNKTVSERYHMHVTPAGYAFSIWSVIFLLTGASSVGLMVTTTHVLVMSPTYIFAASIAFVLSGFWGVVFAHERFLGSVVVMLSLWSCVALAYKESREAFTAEGTTVVQYVLYQLPWSIYFGWVSVATLVNISVYLRSPEVRWAYAAGPTWAILVEVVATCLGLAFVLLPSLRDVAYACVVVWALVAIGRKNATEAQQGLLSAKDKPVVVAAAAQRVVTASIVLCAILVGTTAIVVFRK